MRQFGASVQRRIILEKRAGQVGSARRNPNDFFIRHAFVDGNCQFFIYWESPMNPFTKLQNFNLSNLPQNEPRRASCEAHQMRAIWQVGEDEVVARM
jgi:hypothetical protein